MTNLTLYAEARRALAQLKRQTIDPCETQDSRHLETLLYDVDRLLEDDDEPLPAEKLDWDDFFDQLAVDVPESLFAVA